MEWQIVILLFIHLLVDNILLGHAKRTTSSTFVNFGSPSC